MNVTWKRLLVIATFVSPAAALAAGAAEDKEKSNHGTNKKAIAMEAKEDKVRGPGVRNWAAIDTDKDHSISPEEMQKFLTEQWSAKGKS